MYRKLTSWEEILGHHAVGVQNDSTPNGRNSLAMIGEELNRARERAVCFGKGASLFILQPHVNILGMRKNKKKRFSPLLEGITSKSNWPTYPQKGHKLQSRICSCTHDLVKV